METFCTKWSEKTYTKNENAFQPHPSFLQNFTPVASRTRGETRHEDCKKVQAMKVLSQKGLTLIELLIVVNIVGILLGAASIGLSEYSDEARSLEVYSVFPQVIRSQKVHFMRHNQYYGANHGEFQDHAVDVSEVEHFAYSTFSNASDSFSVRADAGTWAAGGGFSTNMAESPHGVVMGR